MSEDLWTAYEAAAATGGALCARGGDPRRWAGEEWAAQGLSIDTRTLQPGEIFIALKDARDGHEFVNSAFERGAAAAMVATAPENAPEGAPLLVVRDTLDGLRDLARAARLRSFGKRVGVTGSVGKTSVKEMLRTALSACGTVHAAERSFNNHLGVPLTLASMPMRADYGVFEIGMNHAGEITPLTTLASPHVAIVTTVAPAHLAFFDSVAGIAEAKAEIFLGVEQGGAAILPRDNDHFPLLRQRAVEAGVERLISFGQGADADYRLTDVMTNGTGAVVEALIDGANFRFQLGAAGRHQAMNALAALAAADVIGADRDIAAHALAGFAPGAGRGLVRSMSISGATVSILDESYNANPTSMDAAIALLGAKTPKSGGRRIAVLGDMLELGEAAPGFHAGLCAPLEAAGVSRLYVTGSLMDHLWSAAPKAMCAGRSSTANEIAAMLLDDLRDGDIILVKGSNASKIGEVIAGLENASETG